MENQIKACVLYENKLNQKSYRELLYQIKCRTECYLVYIAVLCIALHVLHVYLCTLCLPMLNVCILPSMSPFVLHEMKDERDVLYILNSYYYLSML